MSPFTGTDLVGAAAFSMAFLSAVLLLALLSRAREDVLMSPLGWRLVAAALGLFAFRGILHFIETGLANTLQHLSGLAAAVLLPVGLYLVLRASREKEVGSPGSGD